MFVPLAPWAGHYGHSTDIYSRNVGREREKGQVNFGGKGRD